MRQVTIQFLKNPDILHWGFEAVYLGEDEHGWWMALPEGARRWKGDAEVSPNGSTAVLCAPRDGWWHLHYNGSANRLSHFVDIVTQPAWVTGERMEMIDLDLDVIVHQDGLIEVEDEDEFEIHQRRYEYTPEMITRAREETDRVVSAIQRREEPFFAVAQNWLTKV